MRDFSPIANILAQTPGKKSSGTATQKKINDFLSILNTKCIRFSLRNTSGHAFAWTLVFDRFFFVNIIVIIIIFHSSNFQLRECYESISDANDYNSNSGNSFGAVLLFFDCIRLEIMWMGMACTCTLLDRNNVVILNWKYLDKILLLYEFLWVLGNRWI